MGRDLPGREISPACRQERGRDGGPRSPELEAAVSLGKARGQVELVCQMLLRPSPEVLSGCENVLTAAVAEMEASRPGWRGMAGDRRAGEEARRTRKALQHARRLLENAVNFHRRWQRMRAAMTGGYQADGTPGQFSSPSRILVKG